jgi:hypothetical protein
MEALAMGIFDAAGRVRRARGTKGTNGALAVMTSARCGDATTTAAGALQPEMEAPAMGIFSAADSVAAPEYFTYIEEISCRGCTYIQRHLLLLLHVSKETSLVVDTY